MSSWPFPLCTGRHEHAENMAATPPSWGPNAGADAVAGGTRRDVSILVMEVLCSMRTLLRGLRSRQFPTFAFNSSKKFSTTINSHPPTPSAAATLLNSG